MDRQKELEKWIDTFIRWKELTGSPITQMFYFSKTKESVAAEELENALKMVNEGKCKKKIMELLTGKMP